MQSRVLQQVIFSLSWLILSKAQDVIGSGLSCLRYSPADAHGQTRITFLREDAAGARSLYLTLWSEDMRLLTCEVTSSPLATERYRTLCDRSGTQSQEITRRLNISVLSAPDAPCALVSSSAPKFPRRTRRDGTEGKARRKRAWILPGTLWCGKGNEAVRYEQLGMFEDADRCCREHDHCLHIIPAFTVNYGVFNPNLYTVSHCDCDQRFRRCLQDVNDTVSSMVGYSFFNILRVPCFELKTQRRCTQIYWWGMCKVAKQAPYAVFKNPLPYNTSDVANKYLNNTRSNKLTSEVTKSHVIGPCRKSQKSEHRCGSRDPPRQDTFYRRGTKGKGCKTHCKLSTVAPPQMPSLSQAHTTTPSMITGLLNPSKSKASMSNKNIFGKEKRTRERLLAYPTQRSQVPPQVTINSYPQPSSTTQSMPPLTQSQNHSTAISTATKTRKSHRKAPKQSCCGSRMPVREFPPRCKSGLEQATRSHLTIVRAATTTNGLLVKVTTETSGQDTLKRLWNTATFATPITTKLKTAASLHEDGKPQKEINSRLLENKTGQEPMGSTIAQSTKEERILKQSNALRNMTDNQLLCGSFKHLDECKYQIPPLQKKYDLQNMESKTAYHCGCTSRLAVQIKSFKQPSVLPTLVMDFVSHYCFRMPKDKKCHRRKSCSGGFIKASDLLRALKKIEEKDTAGVRNSGNDRKRGNPVRLYKRCLRLEREADIMAQLT
ncbi:group 3 secretory phospholipase A2-like isoform X1 [Seriola aureovittata]|uniref:group 3 secretory phospholipase A2-like isoform X1 n=1 Tax=Seriola aureovittata TaxID=2871759 RepID=UPI0024BD6189|nr:group 3 secretory phospholipase A2-like isoform X1 [Seriola aureovittata]